LLLLLVRLQPRQLLQAEALLLLLPPLPPRLHQQPGVLHRTRHSPPLLLCKQGGRLSLFLLLRRLQVQLLEHSLSVLVVAHLKQAMQLPLLQRVLVVQRVISHKLLVLLLPQLPLTMVEHLPMRVQQLLRQSRMRVVPFLTP
jgi:hypothetical protein